MPSPPRKLPTPRRALRWVGRAIPWLGMAGAIGGAVWLQQELETLTDTLDGERERCDAVIGDVMEERLADRRLCQADKAALDEEHRIAIDALKAAFAERERILEAQTRLEVEQARLAGAESVLAAASSTDPDANPLLIEVRRLREEMELRQADLAEADAQLVAASEEIERLGKEKRKLARALDAATLSVAEAEQARADAAREVQAAKERAVELEWDRFTVETVQGVCWDGSKRRRDRCQADVERILLQSKVEWLVCKLEEGARPTITRASSEQPPTAGARLLADRGTRSAWLVLCDHSLRDAGDAILPVTP